MCPKFKPNQQIVHPKHGLGCIGTLREEDVGGHKGRYLTVAFPRTALTIRIPEAKLGSSGLRHPASAEQMRAVLAVLTGPPAAPQGHWGRYAAEYGQKLNSGDPKLLAEVMRDLKERRHNGWGSRLFKEALLRLAEELAVVEGVAVDAAQARIEELLFPAAPAAGT